MISNEKEYQYVCMKVITKRALLILSCKYLCSIDYLLTKYFQGDKSAILMQLAVQGRAHFLD